MASSQPTAPAASFSWTNLAAFAMVFVVSLGGGWKLVNQELSSQDRAQRASVEALKHSVEMASKSLEEQEALRHKYVDDRLARLTVLIDEINRELTARRSEFLNQDEFRQFSSRFESVREELKLLQSARPTTGELQGLVKALEERINRQSDRIRALEAMIEERRRSNLTTPSR